jgi:hypothetical protein
LAIAVFVLLTPLFVLLAWLAVESLPVRQSSGARATGAAVSVPRDVKLAARSRT